jgi:RNA polymerase sigma-70 factor (ECF subfamily)
MNQRREFIPTRQSLLSRLKNREDQESWRVFFGRYWKLIYNAALKAGLTDAEAEDVVQETMLSVLKSMPRFHYEPQRGSFKNWLMRLTSWRIADQLRRRKRDADRRTSSSETSTDTALIERIPDPAGPPLEAIWNEEWERSLVAAALERVKRRVDQKQYQVFHLHAVKQWPVLKVAHTLNMNRSRIYLIKHRINRLLEKELAYLRTRPD